MFLYTNYSLFVITELRVRLSYIILSFFLTSCYSIYYTNEFLIVLLAPLEYLNIDNNFVFFIYYIFNTLWWHNTNDLSPVLLCEETPMIFDYFPVHAVNISNNFMINMFLFTIINILFLLPLLVYHVYLFFLPGLFVFEKNKLQIQIIQLLLYLYIYFKYIHCCFLYVYLSTHFNNYYEFFNLEFDIEFDVLHYIYMNCKFIIIFCFNMVLVLIGQQNINKTKMVLFFNFIFLNLYIWIYIMFLFQLYLFLYLNITYRLGLKHLNLYTHKK